jgi:hypothetical protein
VLDGVDGPSGRTVRIEPGGPARPALSQQIPALVELLLHCGKSETIELGRVAVGFLGEQLVFLVGKIIDPPRDCIIHDNLLRPLYDAIDRHTETPRDVGPRVRKSTGVVAGSVAGDGRQI